MILIALIQPDARADSTSDRLDGLYDASWQIRQTLYLCQVIYGWSSIVFVPFMLPFLQNVLTHAPPTAYDVNGRCRKFKGPDPPPNQKTTQELFRARSAQALDSIFSAGELDDFFKKVKSVAAGTDGVDMEALRQRAGFRNAGTDGEGGGGDVENPATSS